MLEKVKYDIGNKVRAKVNYINDSLKEVNGVVRVIEIDGENNIIRYQLHIEPAEFDKKMGCTGSIGYVDQDDILELID